MPKTGFRSIRIDSYTYDKFRTRFEENRKQLEINGVNSLSGYMSYMLKPYIQEGFSPGETPMMKRLCVEGGHIILMDKTQQKIVDVFVQDGQLYCKECGTYSCIHIGFVHTLPESTMLL